MVIEMKNISKEYKNGRGIKNISLSVDEGEIFGFLGPNGSGKTTAMKILCGMMQPDSGEFKLFGYNPNEKFEEAMKKVGCLIETSEAYPYLTAYENLKLFSRFYDNVDDDRIDEVLSMTGIKKYKNEKPKNFSLGMKQRLGLSLALLSKPSLIILDEPLNGLDVEGMVQIRKLIKSLSENEKITFFISSHLIHDVELTCTKVAVILEGSVTTQRTMNSILNEYPSLEDFFIEEVNSYGKL